MRSLLAVLAAILASYAWTTAQAEPTPADKALAEALFRDGRQLIEAGNAIAACPKFAESQRIDPKLGTLLNLASCHEQMGKTASAWAEFTEAASQASATDQRERADFANEHAAALEKKLIYIVVEVNSPPQGLVIKLNDQELSAAALGSPIPVDPGEHAITVTAPGRKPWSMQLKAEEGPARIPVLIPALASAAPSPPPESPPIKDDTTTDGSGQRTAAFVLGGIGIVGLGMGAGFGINTFIQQGVVDQHCGDKYCDQTGLDADQAAHTSATISTIAFAAGLGSAAASAILFLTAKPAKTKGSSIWLLPSVGVSGTSLSVRGAF